MSLIEVEASLHAHHWTAVDVPKYKVTFVAFHCMQRNIHNQAKEICKETEHLAIAALNTKVVVFAVLAF